MRTKKTGVSFKISNMFSSKENVARLSILVISILVITKLIASFVTGSVGIRADAFHSMTDFIGAVVALLCIRISLKPADRQHSFGHGKAESIAAIFVALLIFAAAGTIIFEAVNRLVKGGTPETLTVGLYITGVAIVINLLLSWHVLRVATIHDSIALKAMGRDLLADSYSSIGVLVGLLIGVLTGLTVLDPIVALLVAFIIARTAYQTLRQALEGIMDVRLTDYEERIIKSCIEEYGYLIVNFKHLRTRKSGNERFVDFKLIVPKDLSVERAHALCDQLEARMSEKLDPVYTVIHTEPCTDQCSNCTVLCRD